MPTRFSNSEAPLCRKSRSVDVILQTISCDEGAERAVAPQTGLGNPTELNTDFPHVTSVSEGRVGKGHDTDCPTVNQRRIGGGRSRVLGIERLEKCGGDGGGIGD